MARVLGWIADVVILNTIAGGSSAIAFDGTTSGFN